MRMSMSPRRRSSRGPSSRCSHSRQAACATPSFYHGRAAAYVRARGSAAAATSTGDVDVGGLRIAMAGHVRLAAPVRPAVAAPEARGSPSAAIPYDDMVIVARRLRARRPEDRRDRLETSASRSGSCGRRRRSRGRAPSAPSRRRRATARTCARCPVRPPGCQGVDRGSDVAAGVASRRAVDVGHGGRSPTAAVDATVSATDADDGVDRRWRASR